MSQIPQTGKLIRTLAILFFLLPAALVGLISAPAAADEPEPGVIRVECEPGLEVRLNGALRGTSTAAAGGLIIRGVPPGRHEVGVSRPGMEPQTREVVVRPGQTAYVSIRLPTGSLLVRTVPRQADIRIERLGISGEKTGDTWVQDRLPPGRHRMVVESAGLSLEYEVEIRAGERTEVMLNIPTGVVTDLVQERREQNARQQIVVAGRLMDEGRLIEARRALNQASNVLGEDQAIGPAKARLLEMSRPLIESFLEEARPRINRHGALRAQRALGDALLLNPDEAEAERLMSELEPFLPPSTFDFLREARPAADARQAQAAWARYLEQDVEIESSVGLRLRIIPPGDYLRGSPGNERGRAADERQHRVTLTRPFRMSVTEVTQGQWKRVMGTAEDDNPSHSRGDALPVEGVSWDQAMAFCGQLTRRDRINGVIGLDEEYRLPTEAEWEYAARAGSVGPFHTGNDEAAAARAGWINPQRRWTGTTQTRPPRQFQANGFGLYDMHGNVGEWCLDWYGPYPEHAVVDPTGPEEGRFRVLRGGSWLSPWTETRAAARMRSSSDGRPGTDGFRVVLTIKHELEDPSPPSD